MSKSSINRKVPYEMIREAVFAKYIANGAQPGSRLPSDRALAEEFGVNVATIAKGLSSLSQEGFLQRRVGSGTYISKAQKQQHQTCGVFFGATATSYLKPEMAPFIKIDRIIQQTIYSRDIPFAHYADTRIREYWAQPHPALLRDVQQGRISELIVIRANPENAPWLSTLDLPITGYVSGYGGSVVDIDLNSFFRQSIEHLAKTGCQSTGLIAQFPPACPPHGQKPQALHQGFFACCEEKNIQTGSEWTYCESFENVVVHDIEQINSEIFGYTAFQNLWNSSSRPQSLVVYSDIVGLGVIRAAKDLGVDLSRDIKTIFFSYHGASWPALEYHTRMSFSLKDISNALIALSRRSQTEPLLIKPVLIQPD